MQSELATDVGLLMVGDYKQRRTGKTPGGKYACFERGNTSHFRGECPVCVDKMKTFGSNGKGKGGF